MGCDIHMYAEIKKGNNWEKVGDVFENKYYEPDRKQDEYNKPLTDHPYKGRNYNLFSILANVRNGYGFAGCKTGEGFIPICMPKGMPDDVSADVALERIGWGSDGHSDSWLTLQEILNYDFDQTTIHEGYVNGSEYKYYIENGHPNS